MDPKIQQIEVLMIVWIKNMNMHTQPYVCTRNIFSIYTKIDIHIYIHGFTYVCSVHKQKDASRMLWM